MVRADLTSALINALERGEEIGKAKQSLINSGYNKADVEEAVKNLSGGGKIARKPMRATIASRLPSKPVPEVPRHKVPEQNVPKQKLPVSSNIQRVPVKRSGKKSHLGLIILLVGVFIILAGILVSFVFFQDNITDFLRKILGK